VEYLLIEQEERALWKPQEEDRRSVTVSITGRLYNCCGSQIAAALWSWCRLSELLVREVRERAGVERSVSTGGVHRIPKSPDLRRKVKDNCLLNKSCKSKEGARHLSGRPPPHPLPHSDPRPDHSSAPLLSPHLPAPHSLRHCQPCPSDPFAWGGP
jgi:hypothetical protein